MLVSYFAITCAVLTISEASYGDITLGTEYNYPRTTVCLKEASGDLLKSQVQLTMDSGYICDAVSNCQSCQDTSVPRPFYTLFPNLGWFKLHNELMEWDEARDICRSEGTDLAFFNSTKDAQLVVTELASRLNSVTTTMWIGITNPNKDGKWITVTNKLVSDGGFNTWVNDHIAYKCGTVNEAIQMDDYWCNARFSFLCMKSLQM